MDFDSLCCRGNADIWMLVTSPNHSFFISYYYLINWVKIRLENVCPKNVRNVYFKMYLNCLVEHVPTTWHFDLDVAIERNKCSTGMMLNKENYLFGLFLVKSSNWNKTWNVGLLTRCFRFGRLFSSVSSWIPVEENCMNS